MDVGTVLVLVVAAFMALLFILGTGSVRDVEYDCDLRGRHVKTRQWQGSKAAANHVCDECGKHEDAQRRHYEAIDRGR